MFIYIFIHPSFSAQRALLHDMVTQERIKNRTDKQKAPNTAEIFIKTESSLNRPTPNISTHQNKRKRRGLTLLIVTVGEQGNVMRVVPAQSAFFRLLMFLVRFGLFFVVI